jgi:hypothetical protein
MVGIEQMVRHRGMESLGVYPFGQTVRKYLVMFVCCQLQFFFFWLTCIITTCRHHMLMTAINARPISPIFNCDFSNPSSPPQVTPVYSESPLYCPLGAFDQVSQSRLCSEQTLHILYAAKDLIDLLVYDCESQIEQQEFYAGLFDVKTRLESHFPATEPQSPSYGDWIFESCRLASHLLLAAAEASTGLISSDPALTTSLVQALARTDIGGNWDDMLGVLYWVLLIGSASSRGRPCHRILDSMLGRTLFDVAFASPEFVDAVIPTKRFALVQLALKRRAERTLFHHPS